MITITIYSFIILYIICRGFYISRKPLCNVQKRESFQDSISLSAMPFYSNMGSINLFAFAINFLLLSFISLTLLPDLISNTITYCQGEDSFLLNNYKNSLELHKELKNSIDTYIFEEKTSSIILSKNIFGNTKLDDYLTEILPGKRTIIDPKSQEFIRIPTNFEYKIKVPNTDDNVFGDRPIKKYSNLFNCHFEDYLKYNINETTDPLIQMRDLSNIMAKTPAICNNIIVEYLNLSKNNNDVVVNFGKFKDPYIRFYKDEIHSLILNKKDNNLVDLNKNFRRCSKYILSDLDNFKKEYQNWNNSLENNLKLLKNTQILSYKNFKILSSLVRNDFKPSIEQYNKYPFEISDLYNDEINRIYETISTPSSGFSSNDEEKMQYYDDLSSSSSSMDYYSDGEKISSHSDGEEIKG